jgi:hypothetical protein
MKRLIGLLSIVITVSVAQAQNFEQFNISQNLSDPRMVTCRDFNGDARDEMVIASSEGLYLYENQGSNQFVKRALLDSVEAVYRFSLFDWGNDGDLDIFYTTFGLAQQVAWLENDGNQNFTHHLITDTIPSPFYVRPFDIDQDSDVDILLSSSSTDELYWLKNNGSNVFTSVDTIGNFINHFEIADLHGDNDWDIIFGRTYTGFTISEVRTFQNDGNNNFSMQVLKSGFSVIHEVFTKDINGDGYFDILVPDYHGDALVWLTNDGSYSFSNQSIIKNNFDGPQGVDVRDVNGDGKMDVIAGSYNDDEIYYFQGQGSVSSFSFSSGTLLYNGLISITDLAIGDFDVQNNLDFAHIDLGSDELSTWVNNGNQSFTQNRLAFSFDSPRAFDMQDIDGDGDQDLATVSNDGDMVAWMENVGNDNFETHILATNYEEPYSVRINDLDDDGDFDIVACSNNDDRVTWWRNDGPGNFVMIQIATNLNGPRDFWIEDFDNDGDKDIAVICYWIFNKIGNTGAQWLKNDGNENFTRFEIQDDVRAGRSMRGADMNGDTLIDVVISSYFYTASKLRIAVNNGNGFGIATVGDLLCEDFEIVDFDGDQDNDILAIDFVLDSLYYYENLGNLQFSRHTLAHIDDLYGIAPRDFDGDGDMDVIFTTGFSGFTNGSGFEWGIFRNDGTGNLSTEIWYQNLSMVKPMEVFDYELDGDVDVVIGFDFADKITLYKNLDIDCYLTVGVAASGNTSFCSGDSVLLSAITNDTGISYQWYRNSMPIPNATTTQFLADSSGFYQVAISDTTCTAFSAVQQVVAGSIYTDSISLAFCQNDSIVLDSLTISFPGNYTIHYTSRTGCDSTVTYQVTQKNRDSSFISAVICSGSTYMFGGQQLTQGGMYTNTLTNSENCDSVVYLNLTVSPVYSQSQSLNLCSGDSAFLPGGYWVNQSGTYVDTLLTGGGCDSIWSTQVAVNPILTTNEAYTICQGDSLLIHGVYQSNSGNYRDTLVSTLGCDSIVAVSLTVLPHVLRNITASICQGDSLFLGGEYRVQAGTYYDTLMAANSCDSIISTNLVVLQPAQQSVSLTICQGDSVFLANAWRKSTGNYIDTLTAANGCDSILTSVLTVNPTISGTSQLSICQGDSIFLANAWRTTAGNYPDTLTATSGCDSIHTYVLIVDPLINTNAQANICAGDSIFLGGSWQTTAGNYVDVFTSANQCDSTVTTQLTVTTVDTAVTRVGNTLTATAATASFQWLDCNANFSAIPGATNATYSPTANGSYAVQIGQSGCVDTSQCFDINTIGLREEESGKNFVIYPNPSSGVITVSGTLPTSAKVRSVRISIIDASGARALELPVEINGDDLNTSLDLSGLPNGVYQLKISSGNASFVQSLVLAK